MATTRRDHVYLRCQRVDVDECAALGGRVVTELAVSVCAPTLHVTARRECTTVAAAGRDGGNTGRESGNADRRRAIDATAIANLSAGVIAPAFEATAEADGAAVIAARRNDVHAIGQSDRIDRHRALRGAAVAQLAAAVQAPTFDAAPGSERAGVCRARRNRRHARRQAADIDRCAVRRDGAVAELTIAVRAPTFDATDRGQCTGVQTTRGNRSNAAGQATDIDRYIARRGGGVT